MADLTMDYLRYKQMNSSEENNPDMLSGKTIKKMSWSNDGMTGTRVYFETDDGYVLTYLLGFKGDLKYLYTKDAG